MSDNRHESDDEKLMAAVRAELECDAAALDVFSVARLKAARIRALAQTSPPRLAWAVSWGLPTGAFATAILASLSIWQIQQPSVTVVDVPAVEALAAEETADLYENLDFYEWLEQQVEVSDERP